MVRDPIFPIRKLVQRQAVLEFNKNYIFSVALAKELKTVSTSRFVYKIKSRGINPVGGIGINGARAYFFKRVDLEVLNIEKIPSDGLGFKKDGIKNFSNDFLSNGKNKQQVLSLVQAMRILGVTLPQVMRLVNKNILCRVIVPTSQVMVSKKSVNAYCKVWKDEKLVSIQQAASMVGETHTQFISRWVKSQVVRVRDIELRKCISLDAVERINNIKHHYVLAPDCPKMWFVVILPPYNRTQPVA